MAITTLYYLDAFTDEVMPCGPSLDAWAAWLSKPAPDWNRPSPAVDGETFTAQTLVSHGEITVDRAEGGARADTADGWRITGQVDDTAGQFFLVVPGGWDNEHSGATVDATLSELDDPGPHRLEWVSDGPAVLLRYHASPPRLEVVPTDEPEKQE